MISSAPSSAPFLPTVSVTGHGRREIRPDQVEFHFTLSGVYPTVAEAEEQLQRESSILFSALSEFRLLGHLTANGPSIAPSHEYERHISVFKGFKATEHLALRVPLEDEVVTSVLQAVASQLKSVSLHVRFSSRKTAAALRSARGEAVRDARRKATHFAAAAGHRLGSLRSLSDSSKDNSGDSVVYETASGSTGIDPDEQIVTAEIDAVWELLANA